MCWSLLEPEISSIFIIRIDGDPYNWAENLWTEHADHVINFNFNEMKWLWLIMWVHYWLRLKLLLRYDKWATTMQVTYNLSQCEDLEIWGNIFHPLQFKLDLSHQPKLQDINELHSLITLYNKNHFQLVCEMTVC